MGSVFIEGNDKKIALRGYRGDVSHVEKVEGGYLIFDTMFAFEIWKNSGDRR